MAPSFGSTTAQGQPEMTMGKSSAKADAIQLEQARSSDELASDHMNYERVDQEIAKYATATGIELSPETNKRLKSAIDKRVLVVMVITYFIQALDKGTLSFASIMGIKTDLALHGQQVCPGSFHGPPTVYTVADI